MFYHQILDIGYAAKLYHARKLMYSINAFQNKRTKLMSEMMFFIFAKIAYKNFTHFMNF